ncbi:CBS domain-containing protein [Sporomusaceae bacterium BoRhaA]|uniref:CBS domain-containing protein n=1 Tax=Pelorhabdus rhamnosifermentans TaxID=2772457 RepID=UPI001FE95713|nr:CBS domain-containing protein [Pelorhabdus rhamnosifermentans]MBU2701433.1 CBS domain-containing protein [Pelorhabdus rhamnosifermentans]
MLIVYISKSVKAKKGANGVMNIAFFLIPKSEVVYLPVICTMRQALEKMEYHRYTAIPLIDDQGKYAGTLTEGDLLWKMKNTPGLTFADTEKVTIQEIPWRMKNNPVHVNSEIEELFSLAIDQNFVPVVDDSNIFIGIIRRREIIEYYQKNNIGNR